MKNFSNLIKNINAHIQEAQWTWSKINSKKSIPNISYSSYQKPNLIKWSQNQQERMIHHKKISLIRLIIDFSLETTEARGQWDNVFKMFQGCWSKILYSAKLFFKYKEEIKTFLDKQNWKNLWREVDLSCEKY